MGMDKLFVIYFSGSGGLLNGVLDIIGHLDLGIDTYTHSYELFYDLGHQTSMLFN